MSSLEPGSFLASIPRRKVAITYFDTRHPPANSSIEDL